jgi:hypothetical protein
VSEWSCHSNLQQAEGQLTVGKVFELNCHGPWGAYDDLSKFEYLPQSPEQKYDLKIIAAKAISSEDIQFLVTSYKTGEVQLNPLVFSYDEKKINLGELRFNVQSVLDPKQKNEPFAAYGPLVMSWPPIFWVCLLVFAGILTASLGQVFLKVFRRKKFLKSLQSEIFYNNPAQEFYQTIRKLRRTIELSTIEHVQVLDLALRKYLTLKYKEDFTQIKRMKSLRAVLEKGLFEKLSILLNELKLSSLKSHAHHKTLSEQDLRQLIDESQKVVDQIEALKVKS